MKKRIGSICLAVSLLVSAIPMNVQATELINDLNNGKAVQQAPGQSERQ